MLQSIRDRTHGWIAGIIISLLILSFALWGIHSYLESAGSDNVAAKVNGKEISNNQVTVAYDRLRRQLQLQYSANYELPLGAEAELKQRALQSLIGLQVLSQASLAEGYRITTQQIDGFLQSMPEFQANGEFSLARFQQMLATTLFSASDFLDLIKTNLLINQPRLGLVFTSFALPDEINQTIALVGQERDINYLVIPQNYFPAQTITISDQSVHDYYDHNQNEFKTQEQVSLDYIALSTTDLMNSIHPTEDAQKNFYNENSNSFMTPTQWQLTAIILPLSVEASDTDVAKAESKMSELIKAAQNSNNFAELAKRFSVNNASDKFHGWVSINQVQPELQRAVSNLTRANAVSQPVRTRDGLVLIKAVGYKEAKIQPYDAVKNDVRNELIHQQAQEQLSSMKEKLANLTYEHPDTLAAAAQELGLPVKTTVLFTKDKGGNDITANNKVREAAFSNDVLTLQNNSDVIQLTPDSAIVVRVKSHVPASLLLLTTVQNQIIDKLRQQAIQEKLAQLANEIKTQLQTGALKPDQVESKYHFTWNHAGFIGRHATKIDQAVLDTAFEMPAIQNGSTYAAARVANGYAVISLNGVKSGTLTSSDSKQQYQAFAEQIQNSQGMLEYELYKDDLMSQAKIHIED